MAATVHVRSEQMHDYASIAEVHALAFSRDASIGEVPLVGVHRYRRAYDPDLSIVAEVDGQIVGHALFTPHVVRVGGEALGAVLLSPISVLPGLQKTGIGTTLVKEGLRLAKEKGYVFSFLLGHKTYYPRFGYRTGMYGTCRITLEVSAIDDMLPGTVSDVRERPVGQTDLALLREMWDRWYGTVDLAIEPSDSIVDWVSIARNIRASVITKNGSAIGYVRYQMEHPQDIQLFLAKDEEATSTMLAYLRSRITAYPSQDSENPSVLRLQVHPQAATTISHIGVPFGAEMDRWDSGMIRILADRCPAIEAYCHEVEAGLRPPGLIIWPGEFSLC